MWLYVVIFINITEDINISSVKRKLSLTMIVNTELNYFH